MRKLKVILPLSLLLLAVVTCVNPFDILPYTPYDPTSSTGTDGIWKNVRTRYQYTGDATRPAMDTTYTVAATFFDSAAMASVDIYTQIVNDTLYAYEYYLGDTLYYRVSQPLTPGAEQYTFTVAPNEQSAIFDSMGTSIATTFRMQDTNLVRVSVVHCTKGDCSGAVTTVTSTFNRAGIYWSPPAGWPYRIVPIE